MNEEQWADYLGLPQHADDDDDNVDLSRSRQMKNFQSRQLSAAAVAIQRRWRLWRSEVARPMEALANCERLEANLLQPSLEDLASLQQQEAVASQQSTRNCRSLARKQLPIGAAPTRISNRPASRGPVENWKQCIETPSGRPAASPQVMTAANHSSSPTRRWGSGTYQASARSPPPGNARKAHRGAGLSYYPRGEATQQHDQQQQRQPQQRHRQQPLRPAEFLSPQAVLHEASAIAAAVAPEMTTADWVRLTNGRWQ